MIIFFGTRATRIDAIDLHNATCPHCNSQNTLVATKYGRYFHIFFLPIFPTSEKTIVECRHCYKSYEGESFAKVNPNNHEEKVALIETKRPLWHSCGCLLIVLIIAFSLVSTCTAYIFRSDDVKVASTFEKDFNADYNKLTNNPDCKKDSVSCAVKMYFDLAVVEELDKKNFEYFSRIDGNKVLILVKIDDMKKIDSSVRYKFIDEIKRAAKLLSNMKGKDYYIGVRGKWNFVVIHTPLLSDTGGSFADESLLYDFYEKV